MTRLKKPGIKLVRIAWKWDSQADGTALAVREFHVRPVLIGDCGAVWYTRVRTENTRGGFIWGHRPAMNDKSRNLDSHSVDPTLMLGRRAGRFLSITKTGDNRFNACKRATRDRHKVWKIHHFGDSNETAQAPLRLATKPLSQSGKSSQLRFPSFRWARDGIFVSASLADRCPGSAARTTPACPSAWVDWVAPCPRIMAPRLKQESRAAEPTS